MGKQGKVADKDHVGLGTFFVWNANSASRAVQTVLVGFITIYYTNAVGLSPLLVGSVMMASKILDGFTDLFAGYIVDKTNTKIGRGRPYEIALIGLWLTDWALFSVPTGFSTVGKCVWIFIFYALSQSVFNTLLNAAGTVYMVRAFNSEKIYITLNSFGGFVVTAAVMVFNVIFPIFEAKILYSATGWSSLVLFVALPMIVIGLLRFFLIPEKYNVDADQQEQLKFKDVVAVFKTNKYIFILALLGFITNVSAGMAIGNYYYIYVVKNLEISGVMNLVGLIPMVTLFFYPVILKKLSTAKLIQYSMLFSVPAAIIFFIAKDNLGLLAIAGMLSGMVSLPASYMMNILIVDCATFNEWKGIPRMEGTLNSIVGFAQKIGTAFGSFFLGILLNVAGFDGTLTEQGPNAIMMLRLLGSFIPMIFSIPAFIAFFFWKLDKLKPQMEKECAERREIAAQKKAETQQA